MKTHLRNLGPALAAFAVLIAVPVASQAQCGGLRIPRTRADVGRIAPHLLRADFVTVAQQEEHSPGAPIVGFWHVKFVVGSGAGAVTIDAGYSQWHSDGTEIMNSGGRAPVTSSFCLGVWKPVGARTYALNHFAASWDPTPRQDAPNGVLLGPARIQELVTLDPDGDHFSGTFIIDQFDEHGNVLGHVAGAITGVRITPDTPEESIF